MTATILFVDDEPDLEALILQKFRRQIRDGLLTLMFARDGLEALEALEQNPGAVGVTATATRFSFSESAETRAAYDAWR